MLVTTLRRRSALTFTLGTPRSIAGGYLAGTPRGPLSVTFEKLRVFFSQGPKSLEPSVRSLNQVVEIVDLFSGKLLESSDSRDSRTTRAPITEVPGHPM
jgi:hypothetical protein